MTVDELWKRVTGRTLTEYTAELRRWETVQKAAHERAIRKALIGREEW